VPWREPILLLILSAVEGAAQVVDYPCVPRFRADRSYIHISEASGGQILLLDRSEIASPAVTRSQASGANQTILRIGGDLSAGFQEFAAPVDSTVQLLQFTVFAECVKSIAVTDPAGTVVEGVKLSSGCIVIVDKPEPGVWRVKISGTGYFSAVAQAKAGLVLAPLRLSPPKPAVEQSVAAYLSGPVETAEFRVVGRNGATLQVIPMTRTDTTFKGVFTPPAEPFHIAVEGKDTQGREFRRVHAPLFEAKP
jgi:hypothetical protein